LPEQCPTTHSASVRQSWVESWPQVDGPETTAHHAFALFAQHTCDAAQFSAEAQWMAVE
jgi:hypothetical protein